MAHDHFYCFMESFACVISNTKKETKPYSDIHIQKCELKCSNYGDVYQKYQIKENKDENEKAVRNKDANINLYYKYSR